MPCGGIHPIKGSWCEAYVNPKIPCIHCGKGKCDLFCMEWDGPLHSACVEDFLKTEDGKVILAHKHEVVVMKDGEWALMHAGD